MKDFSQWMGDFQAEWRRTKTASAARRPDVAVGYPWILPKSSWEEGLWPGLRRGAAREIAAYLDREGIEKHTGCNNLKSSWVACANLYFPFGNDEDDRALLASFLRNAVSDQIVSVDGIELEYAEAGELAPSVLLGESGGRRGSGQTSPDVAFLVNRGSGIILTESKLTEHSFYACSARTTASKPDRPGNPDPERCLNARAVMDEPETLCHQVAWGRKYWERLRPVVNELTVSGLKACPAAFAGYQIFRQQALAEGYRTKYDLVVSAVAYDARNEALIGSLASTGIASFPTEWGGLFNGKARFAAWTHQAWVDWVRHHDDGRWGPWLKWIEGRYAYGPRAHSTPDDVTSEAVVTGLSR